MEAGAHTVLGHVQHPLVSADLLWILTPLEFHRLEIREVDQRYFTGSQHCLCKGGSSFCPVFNCEVLPGCLVIAQYISRSKSLMLKGLWQGVRPMKCFFLNVSQLLAVGGSQR